MTYDVVKKNRTKKNMTKTMATIHYLFDFFTEEEKERFLNIIATAMATNSTYMCFPVHVQIESAGVLLKCGRSVSEKGYSLRVGQEIDYDLFLRLIEIQIKNILPMYEEKFKCEGFPRTGGGRFQFFFRLNSEDIQEIVAIGDL